MGILEKIAEIEKEIARTQKNKGIKGKKQRRVRVAYDRSVHRTNRTAVNIWID